MRYNEYEPFRSVDEARVLIVQAQARSGRHAVIRRASRSQAKTRLSVRAVPSLSFGVEKGSSW